MRTDLNQTKDITSNMEAQSPQDLTDFVKRFESQSTEEAETEVYDTMIDIVSDYVSLNTNAICQAIHQAFEARPSLPKGVINSADCTSRKSYSVVRLSPYNDTLCLMIELGFIHQFLELNSLLDHGILIKDNFLSSLRFMHNNYDKHRTLNKRYKAPPIMEGVTPEIYITANLNSSNDVSFALNAGFYLNTYFKMELAKQIQNPSNRRIQFITDHVISDIKSVLIKKFAMDIVYHGIERSIRAEYAKLFYGGAVPDPSSFLDKPLNINTGITLSDYVAQIVRSTPLEFTSSDNLRLNLMLGSSDMVYSIQEVGHEHIVFIKIDRSCMQSTAKVNQQIKSIVDLLGSENLIDARTNWRAEFVSVLMKWFKSHKREIIDGFRDFTKYRADAIKRNRSFASTYTNIDKLADTTCYNVPYTWKFPYSPYIHESYYVFEFGPDVQTRLNEMLGLRDFRFEYNFNQRFGSHNIVVHPPADLLITKPK